MALVTNYTVWELLLLLVVVLVVWKGWTHTLRRQEAKVGKGAGGGGEGAAER